ncbi:MAG: Imm25 family immunity protein [Pirellulales bacterium]
MTTFADNVYEIFGPLQAQHAFVPARAASGKHFASLIRRVSEDVCAYVFVHDGRASNAHLDVDLWVAPPESPDDSLDRLYVGYKLRIGSEYDVDDAFFHGCEMRIVRLLPITTMLVPLIRDELDSPSIRTKRWTAYRIERRVLSCVLTLASSGDSIAVAALEEARRTVDKVQLDSLERACRPLADALLEQRLLDVEVLAFFDGRPDSLASAVANHLYISALGEASIAKS